MKVKFKHGTTTQTVDLDRAWVWVALEEDLKLTVDEADRAISAGSMKVISYSLWLASEATEDFKDWVKKLGDFEVVEQYPKDTDGEASEGP